MFSLKAFVTDTLNKMAGKEPEYKVRQYALGWFEKGVIDEDSLADLETILSIKSLEEGNKDVQNEEAMDDISSENKIIDVGPSIGFEDIESDEDHEDESTESTEDTQWVSQDIIDALVNDLKDLENESTDPFEEYTEPRYTVDDL